MLMLSAWLQRIWYGTQQPPWLLRLLANGYAAWLALRPPARPAAQPLPLLVIGNLVVGGSGKTPLVVHLARFLQQSGLRIAVIARVYHGRERGVQVLADQSTSTQVGDEPLLLYQQLDCPVVVSWKRRHAYDYISHNMTDIDLVISDDGLQHRHFSADISVGVVAAARGFGNARLLPAGPLREPLSRLAGLDYLVLKSDQSVRAEQQLTVPGLAAPVAASAVIMAIDLQHAIRLRDGWQQPLGAFAQQTVTALAAIADPDSFFTALRAHGLQMQAHALPDHSAVPAALWQQLPPDQPLLVTSKDAVKIDRQRIVAGAPEIWVVPLQTELPHSFLHDLLQRCRQLTCHAA